MCVAGMCQGVGKGGEARRRGPWEGMGVAECVGCVGVGVGVGARVRVGVGAWAGVWGWDGEWEV